MPQLRAAGALAGGLRADVARRVGLLEGTPVHVGGGDTHVACLAASGLDGGGITIVSGTTTPLMKATATPGLDAAVMPLVSAHLRPDRWASETNVSTSGAMLRWLREFTGRDYAGLEALAADAPLGARGALVIAEPGVGRGRLGACATDLARWTWADAHRGGHSASGARVVRARRGLQPRAARLARQRPRCRARHPHGGRRAQRVRCAAPRECARPPRRRAGGGRSRRVGGSLARRGARPAGRASRRARV